MKHFTKHEDSQKSLCCINTLLMTLWRIANVKLCVNFTVPSAKTYLEETTKNSRTIVASFKSNPITLGVYNMVLYSL